MALNFPDPSLQTPSNTFSPTSSPSASTNGLTYIYDSEKWKLSSPDVFVEKAGDVMTGDLTVPSLNGGPLAGFRNQLTNGGFDIAQRSLDGTATSDSEYPALDRWAVGGGIRVQQINGVGAVCPGFSYGALVTSTAGRNWFRQAVELPKFSNAGQFASGSTWTVSIWSTKDVSLAIAFSDGVGFVNTSSVQSDVAMTNTGQTRVSGSGAYTYSLYTHTFTLTAAPAATNDCLAVQLSIPFSDSALLAGAQFEPGPVATPFEHRPIATELALCQRYTYVNPPAATSSIIAVGNQSMGNTIRGSYFFPVTMRVPPTASAAPDALTNMNPATWYYINQNYAVAQGIMSATGSAQLNIQAGIVFDAEL